jgi:hypothetical protein
MTARFMSGASCLSNSSHFALSPYSKFVKLVTFPPGRGKLVTNPLPTGSPRLLGGERRILLHRSDVECDGISKSRRHFQDVLFSSCV